MLNKHSLLAGCLDETKHRKVAEHFTDLGWCWSLGLSCSKGSGNGAEGIQPALREALDHLLGRRGLGKTCRSKGGLGGGPLRLGPPLQG